MPTKGQSLSVESIDKMKKAKLNKIVSKYNWIIAEPYMDIEIKNGSTKRTNQYITFREFRKNINDGMSSKDMITTGISKKIVQFFSNFCQGKIKLTRDQFLKDYKEGKSLEDICKKHKVSREDLTYLRQMYNIKRKGATYIQRKKTEIPLTQRQKDILYGSLMGDAKRQNPKWNSIVSFGQSGKQKSYLMWKFIEFENLTNKQSPKFYPPNDDRKEYKNSSGMWCFYTRANSDIEECINKFYKSGKKEIAEDILENLSELSLAVWFMDDGTTSFSYKTRVEKGWNITPEVRLCTDSFSEESCDNIVKWFNEQWGINSHKRVNRPNQYRIVINVDSVSDFFNLIRPYVIPSMLYKIDYNAYIKYREYKKST